MNGCGKCRSVTSRTRGQPVRSAYDRDVDPTMQGVLLALAAVAALAGTFLAWRVRQRQRRGPVAPTSVEETVVPAGVATVLGALRSSAVVVDAEDRVLQASAPAYTLGLVRDGRLCLEELGELVRQVRRDGQTRQIALVVVRGLGHSPSHVQARVAN